jgi:hypothetical protein
MSSSLVDPLNGITSLISAIKPGKFAASAASRLI